MPRLSICCLLLIFAAMPSFVRAQSIIGVLESPLGALNTSPLVLPDLDQNEPSQTAVLPDEAAFRLRERLTRVIKRARDFAAVDNRRSANRRFRRAIRIYRQAERTERIADPVARGLAAEALYSLAVPATAPTEMPAFLGDECDVDAVSRWAQHVFTPWLTRVHFAVERSKASFAPVFELADADWSMAAAANLASLYSTISVSRHDLPDPYACTDDPILGCGGEGPLASFSRNAGEAAAACIAVGLNFGLYTETLRSCLELATQHDILNYPAADEIFRPELFTSVARPRPITEYETRRDSL